MASRKSEIAALHRRLADMARGACGGVSINVDARSEDGESVFLGGAGLEELGRFVGAVRREWGSDAEPEPDDKVGQWFFNAADVYLFDDLWGLAERLHDCGCRA